MSPVATPTGYVAKKLSIESDGYTLKGTLLSPKGVAVAPIVLAFAGNGENVNSFAGDIAITRAV